MLFSGTTVEYVYIYDLKLERPVYREKDDAEMKISGT